jgi:hypothetical protein
MTDRAGLDRLRAAMVVLLTAVVGGCAVGAPVPATVSETPEAAATSRSPSQITPQTTAGSMDHHLVSCYVNSAPLIDGRIDEPWTAAHALELPLSYGMDSEEHALDVTLRSLHTDETIYFLAQWPGEPPSGDDDMAFNKLTIHWRIPDLEGSGTQRPDCAVVCHTAFANGQGDFVYVNAETIPQGGWEALSSAGGWNSGIWTLEWSRPLQSGNPYDVHFTVPDAEYPFLVKIFERVEGRPDPVSRLSFLVFES